MRRWLLALMMLSAPVAVRAQGSVAGTWRTEFETQVGVQKYVLVLKQEGPATSATAKAEFQGQPRDVVFKDVKVNGDTVTFTESFEFQGNSIPIAYRGVLSGDQLKFVRKVGDFATEEFVAKRE